MRTKYLVKIFLFLFFYICFFSNVVGKINNSIVVKVGNEIITNSDLENEIKTMLILSNKNISQSNINGVKNLAIKSLINNLIKKNEIKKQKIDTYHPKELEAYLSKICDQLKTDRTGLKNIFVKNNLNYDYFIEKNKTELIWKTLIYSLYKNQININTVEVENEIKNRLKNKKNKIEYELSEIEISSNSKNIDKLLKDIYKSIEIDGFMKTAKKFSTSTSASEGGKIGLFPEKTLSKIYLTELKKIKSGQITGPIKNSDSFIILKIDSINIIKKEGDIDLDKLKEEVVAKKKEEKLQLFSKSHFTNIQNLTLVKFQ